MIDSVTNSEAGKSGRKLPAGALAAVLCILILAILHPLQAQAQSYSSSWKLWMQGQSSYSKMQKSGCRIVTFAKLLKDAGIAQDASFNPDTFLYWCQHNYNPNQGCSFVFPGEVAQNGDVQDPIVSYNHQVGGNLVYAGRRFLHGNTAQRKQQAVAAVNEGYYVIIGGTSHFSYVDRELTKQYQKLWVDDSGIDYSGIAFWNGAPNVYEVNMTICRHGLGAYDSLYLFYSQDTDTQPSGSVELFDYVNLPVSGLQALIPTLAPTGGAQYQSPLQKWNNDGYVSAWVDGSGRVKNLQISCSNTTQYALCGITTGTDYAQMRALLEATGWTDVLDTGGPEGSGETLSVFQNGGGSSLTLTSIFSGGRSVIDAVTYTEESAAGSAGGVLTVADSGQ